MRVTVFIASALLAVLSGLSFTGPTTRVDHGSGGRAQEAQPILSGKCSPTDERRETLDWLTDEVDLGYPVSLVLDSRIANEWGTSEWDGERYVISLHPEADSETVVHEFAHLMVWDACGESDHDALWGVAYARAYRIVFE